MSGIGSTLVATASSDLCLARNGIVETFPEDPEGSDLLFVDALPAPVRGPPSPRKADRRSGLHEPVQSSRMPCSSRSARIRSASVKTRAVQPAASAPATFRALSSKKRIEAGSSPKVSA